MSKPLKDTKLGKFLKEKAPKVLDKVVDAIPDKGVIGFVKNLLDTEPDIDPAVKVEFDAKYLEFENELLHLQFQDIANSREMNARIQESDKASWLAKNTAYMLDIFISLIWASLTFYIAGKYLNIIKASSVVNADGIWGLYASVTSLMTAVLGWHRGSSKGSEDKQKALDRMLRK